MKVIFLLFVLPIFSDLIDLQDFNQGVVLETKRIQIPGFPYAFNPSIIRWNGYILMSFRVIPDPKSSFTSWLGVLLLDEEFNPVGDPQILTVRDRDSSVPSRAEDARLIYVGEQLHIVYSDNPNLKITGGGFRMVIGELHYENGCFAIRNASYLVDYEGERETLREKNWVPFVNEGSLLLAYSIAPHKIFYPIPGTESCVTVATTPLPIQWNWGVLRGGTQAYPIDTGEYLAFFHSVIKMATENSMGKQMAHYFMGAYTFESTSPFRITHFSREPIVGPGFYSGTCYKPYWAPIQCIFPGGMLIEGDAIWISYGRQDHEIWIAKLDKSRVLASLISIQ